MEEKQTQIIGNKNIFEDIESTKSKTKPRGKVISEKKEENAFGLSTDQYLHYDMFKTLLPYIRDPNICISRCEDILKYLKEIK